MSVIEAIRVLLSFLQGEDVPYKEIYKAFRTLLDSIFVNEEAPSLDEVQNALVQADPLVNGNSFQLLKPLLLKLLLKLLS